MATHRRVVSPARPIGRGRARVMPVRIAAGLLAFAVVFFALQMTRAARQSATWDEPMHLTAGYAAVTARDFRVDPSHPPLARVWAALPLTLIGLHLDTAIIDSTPPEQWLSDGYAFARAFVSGDDLLLLARTMVVFWGVLLGLCVFAWAYEWKGVHAAVLALALYTLEPNLAAHSALVTTDAALTTLAFGAVYFLWRYVRRPGGGDLAALAACAALACVTKFSAVLLAPILALLLVLAVADRRIRFSQAAFVAGVVTMSTVLAIWAVYGFRYAPSDNPNWLLTREAFEGRVGTPWVASAFEWLDQRRLLPNAFAQGFIFSISSARELPAFLAGDVRTGGWWYYFLFALALKTPVAVLALCLAGVVVVGRRPSRDTLTTLAFVLVPIVIWMIAAAFSVVNIGVRHVLPVFPFLILTAAIGAAEFMARRGVARVLVVASLLAIAVEVGRSEPYPLSFFNVLAGGPENGFRYLADSNLGWGGTLKALRQWMDERGVLTINLAYFGSVDPAVYGVRARHLPSSATFLADRFGRPDLPGYVAISGTALDGVYLPEAWRHFYAGFKGLEPAAVVANTLRIYWVDRWPESAEPVHDPASLRTLAEGLLFGLRWPEQALVYYDHYLQTAPADPDGWNGKSLALAQTGRTLEAIAGFKRVLALAPADPNAGRNISLLEQQARQAAMAGPQ